jgi:hypothetical protein
MTCKLFLLEELWMMVRPDFEEREDSVSVSAGLVIDGVLT